MDIDYDNITGEIDELDEFEELEKELESQMDLSDLPDLEEDPDVQTMNFTIVNENLKAYLEDCENKLKTGKIDDYTFMLENLLVKYKQALIHRRFNVTDENDDNRIKHIRVLKSELEQQLVKGIIEEMEFNRKYYNLLDLELTILLKYEDFTLKGKRIEEQVPEDFENEMKSLIKSEHNYLKRVAKERNVFWPDRPKVLKKDSKKIKLQKYLSYYLQLEKSYSDAKKYIPGYTLRTIEEVTVDDPDSKWTIIQPPKLKLERLKDEFLEEKKQSQIFTDQLDQIKIDALKTLLKDKPDNKLLESIDKVGDYHRLSYIERLKLNKINVMKFREYPETYKKIQEILEAEAMYYKISVNDLTKDFNQTFNNVAPNIELEDIPRDFKPVLYVKVGNEYAETELPDGYNLEKKELGKVFKKDYQIEPSSKGYSFLMKVKKLNTVNKRKNDNISEYAEKGSVVSISLKPKYFKSDNVLSSVIDERFYDIIKPLPDELYLKLKAQNLPNNKTDLVQVYELHIPVPELSRSDKTVKLARRYTEFEDYLRDLVKILEVNMLHLENNGAYQSADILYIKIQKINKYLETGIDPELEISSKHSFNSYLQKQPIIQQQRSVGINKLRDYIFEFYPGNEELVETLENDIFNFDHKNYIYNIDKVIFVLKEFDEVLENFIEGNISYVELLGMETKLVLPKDDLEEYKDDLKECFKYLYQWKPENDYYEKYKENIEEVKGDIIKFKKKNSELSQLEINKIFDEYFENKNWETSKIKLRTIDIQKGKNPLRVMISFLKKERNKLMSRRTYRVAKIGERITVRQDLYRIFTMCNLQNFNNKSIIRLSETIENVIYSYASDSDNPDKYKILVDLVKNQYKLLCELITEPKEILPVTVEFIIKEGNFKFINLERLNYIIETLDSDDFDAIIKLLKLMRNEELEAYQKSLIEEQNKDKEPTNYRLMLTNSINKVIVENKNRKKELMYSIAENTYLPPIVTNIIPKIQNGPNSFYVPKYYIIGENEYLYGGNFPTYENSVTGNKNYTDDELYSLAVLLKIDYEEDVSMKELYKKCMNKLTYESDDKKQVFPKDAIIGYNPSVITKKIYTSYVNYTFRKRLNVKPPGEVYVVYKDNHEITYAVPFKFNEFGIPVYSSKFLNKELKDFYYIEGPSEFEDTSEENFIFSTMYILVEYTDKYNKTKLFREGVNLKNVRKSPKELFDACNRFTTELSCNDVNSYGLNKMKCKYIKNKCISTRQEIEKQEVFIDLKSITFKRITKGKKQTEITDLYKTKLWNEALKKANDYISQLLVIKKLNSNQIKELAKEQKMKLIGYYNFLNTLNINKTNLETIIEDPNYNNLKQLTEFFIAPKEVEQQKRQEQEGQEQEVKELEVKIPEDLVKFTSIVLPVLVNKNRNLSLKQLQLGNRYLLPNNSIAILINKEDKLEFDDGTIMKFDNINIREVNASEYTIQKYFKINKDNLKLINNPPRDFKYSILEKEYKVEKLDISINVNKKEISDVPLDILHLCYLEMINNNQDLEKDQINTSMIYNAMGKVMYNVYQRDSNEFLESLDIFPATLEAKVYALKYSVNLIELSKNIKGEIQLNDVINYYNQVLPQVKTISQEIVSQLEYGLLNDDLKLLEKYIKVAEKQSLNEKSDAIAKLIEDANNKIIELKEKKKEVKTKEPKQLPVTEQKTEEAVKVSYIVKKRRKKD